MSLIVSLLCSKCVVLTVLAYLLFKAFAFAFTKIKNRRMAQIHMEKARLRRAARDNSVKRFLEENKFPDADRREFIIGLKDLSEIKHALETKQTTSEEITMTYIYQSATRGLEMEAIADINYEWARKEAIKCDQERAEGKLRGPLHGIPISVKDTVHLEGTVSTNGLTSKSDNVISKDGILCRALKLNGAILFVKSNIPTLLMLPESCNRIFGSAKNYHDYSRVPGGSTGGEGSLISSKCSPAGIGGDIGGSIRIPAAYSGIYGFKPSYCRTNYKGHEPCNHKYPYDHEASIK